MIFHNPLTTLPITLANPGSSFRQQKTKLLYTKQNMKDSELSKSDIVSKNRMCIYRGMALFCMLAPKHTFRKRLKVRAKKTITKYVHQNQINNTETVTNQYLVPYFKDNIRLSVGRNEFPKELIQRELIK